MNFLIYLKFRFNSNLSVKAGGAYNWLGIFGACISDFFINSTIGYFSLVFPVMLFIWGVAFLKKINFHFLIYSSNFLILIGLILSSIFGVLKVKGLTTGINELSGKIGDYLGEIFYKAARWNREYNFINCFFHCPFDFCFRYKT